MQKRKGDEPRAHLLFWLCGSGLGASLVPFRLHQVSEAFRRCMVADLVQVLYRFACTKFQGLFAAVW